MIFPFVLLLLAGLAQPNAMGESEVREYCRASDGQRLFRGLVQLPPSEFAFDAMRSRLTQYLDESVPGEIAITFLAETSADSTPEPHSEPPFGTQPLPVGYFQRIGASALLTMRDVTGHVETRVLRGTDPFMETELGAQLRFGGEYFGHREESKFCEFGIRALLFHCEAQALEETEKIVKALHQLESLLPNPGQLSITITSDLDLISLEESPFFPVELATQDGIVAPGARLAEIFRTPTGLLTTLVMEGRQYLHYQSELFKDPPD